MRTFLLFPALSIILAPAVWAQKVYVDYDRATAFSQYNTFQILETREDLRDVSPSLHRQVVSELSRYLSEGALEEVTASPDVYVAYYTADRSRLRLALSDLRYAYGPEWTWGPHWDGGVGTRTPESFTFNQGTLILDVWDAAEGRLLWRGIATSAVSRDPEKNSKKIDKALKKLTRKWEEMYGGHVRQLRQQRKGRALSRPEDPPDASAAT